MKKPILILGLFMALEPALGSGVPVVDLAQIVETIKNSARQTMQHIQQYNRAVEQVSGQQVAGDKLIKNQQNIAANQIVRSSEMHHRLENLKLKRDSQPAPSACQANYVVKKLDANTCDVITNIDGIMGKTAKVIMGGDKNKTHTENTIDAVQDVITKQAQLSTSLNDPAAGVSANMLLNPLKNGYSKQEEEAADLSRRLIVNPLPPKPAKDLPENKSNVPLAQAHAHVKEYTIAARKMVAAESLAIIQAENTIPEGEKFSKIGLMNKFVGDRILNDEWVMKITNTHPEKNITDGQNTTDAQVKEKEAFSTFQGALLREIALIDAFSSYVDVEIYKSMERQNALLATQLLVKLDAS